LFNNAKLSIN